jgi:2-alkyl-3-oxoalkanoate reductase
VKILVTGGTGFLGSHLGQRLLELGHEPSLMGRDFTRVTGLLENGAKAINVDLRHDANVVGACQDHEVVIHAGALSSPWGRRSDFDAINVGGTVSVLNGCLQPSVRRLIHISSPAVIFDGRDQINAPDNAPYAKKHLSFYSSSKQRAEELVLSKRHLLETIILRPKAIYGPGDRALLPRLIATAKTGRLPRIGDGKNLVDLTHVTDVVEAVVCALECPVKSDFPLYTITGPEHLLLWEVITQLLERLKIFTKFRTLPETVALRLAGVLETIGKISYREPRLTRYTVALLARHQTYDISRARQDLGYSPKVTLAEGLEQTVREFKNL